jgi:SAM-dependent methyltransferase
VTIIDCEQSTAATEGPAWNAAAAGWVESWAGFAAPAREAVVAAAGIAQDVSVLDVACEWRVLGARCRARRPGSGIDAAAALIEVARRKLPQADLRVGPIERLPWPADSFDVVLSFNAFQFAADYLTALAETRRVARRGGRVTICNWGRLQDARKGEVAVPYAFPDRATLERGAACDRTRLRRRHRRGRAGGSHHGRYGRAAIPAR